MKGKLYRDGELLCNVEVTSVNNRIAIEFEVTPPENVHLNENDVCYLESGPHSALALIRSVAGPTVLIESKIVFSMGSKTPVRTA